MPEHEDMVLAVGPYLLGALDPEDRRAVRDHLDTCELCRDELIRLAAVPGFLSHITPRQADPDAEAPAELRARLVDQVLAERAANQRRTQLMAAAVALLVFLPAGMFVALRIGSSLAEPNAPTVVETVPEFLPMESEDSVQGEIAWTAHDWGVEFDLVTWAAPEGQRLRLIAVDQQGREEQAAVWLGSGGRIACPGQTSLRADEIARVVVRDDGDETLLWIDAATAQ
jgi:hypothetical protein